MKTINKELFKSTILIKLVLFLFLGVFTTEQLKSQSNVQNDCGTQATQQQIDYLTQTRSARQSWNQSESIILIPVQHHIIR